MSCGGLPNLSRPVYPTELAAAALGGAVNSTDSPAMLSSSSSLGSTSISSVNTCGSFGPGVSCAAGFSKPTVLVHFPALCSSIFDSSSQWNGEEILQFASGQCTLNGLLGQDLFTGGTLVRTFAPGTSRTLSGSTASVLLDTSTADLSGWDKTVTVGNGTSVTYVTSFPQMTRTLTINGLHLTAMDSNKAIWDATISSTTLAVVGAASKRVIQPNGSFTVQDNQNQVTADITILQQLTFGDDAKNTHCCFPTGGELSARLSGTKTGTETLVFGPTCGQGTLVDNEGHRVSLVLNQCF